MPIVRVYNRQVSLQPAPTPQRQRYDVVQLQTPPPQSAPDAEALGAGFGRATANIGVELARRETARADLAVQTSAEKNLLDWTTTYLRDPQRGVLNTVKGENAIGLEDRGSQELEKKYGEIVQRLNPRQRPAFEQVAQRHIQNFREDLVGHEATETATFQEANHQGLVDLEGANAVNHAADPLRMADSVNAIAQENKRYALSRGLGQAWLDDENAKHRSAIWTNAIDRLLAEDKVPLASAYFEEYQDEILSIEARNRISAKVQTAKTDSLAAQVSNEMWMKLGPKSDQDPANLDVMVDAARSQYAESNPDVFQSVEKTLTDRTNIWNGSVRNRSAANEAKVWGAVLTGAGYDQVRMMPEFQATPGERQVTIKNAIDDRGRTILERARGDESYVWETQQRARSRSEQSEQDATKAAYGQFLELSKTRVLAGLSEDQITNLLPTLGRTLTSQLLEKRQGLKNDAKIADATLNDALFDEIANDAGLKSYAKPTDRTELENARLGQLKSRALGEIDRVQRQNGGKELSEKQKRELLHGMIDTKVLVHLPMRGDREVPAATVQSGETPKSMGNVLASVPDMNLTEAVNYLKSIGAAPQGISRGAVIQQFGDRIARAYLAHQAGDYAAEERILRGDK